MAFNLTPSDQGLSEIVFLQSSGVSPISGYPEGGSRIKFQFPPMILAESKNQKWFEAAKNWTYEPLYMWAGGSPRQATLKATYIVGGPPANGVGRWTAEKVATEVRRWKAYFYSKGPEQKRLALFQLNCYQITGGKNQPPTLWRGLDINIKYSDTLVADDGDWDKSFPLKTEISLKMAMTSNIKTDDGKTFYTFTNVGPDSPPQEWY